MKNTAWYLLNKKTDFRALAETFNIDPLLSKLIINRDIVTEEEMKKYLFGNLNDLYDPFLLKDCKKAAEILIDKIKNHKKIRIIGDYDIDGVCATTILMKGLEDLGAVVNYDIPHRVRDGYGINTRLIDDAFNEGTDTVITCDNGISAIDEIKHAKDLGLTVIITDHHEIGTGEENSNEMLLPEADAVINPHRIDDFYPYKEICGALVAFKLVEALYKTAGKTCSLYNELLVFAAIATVGDIMPLRDENRIIVKEGLKRIKNVNTGLDCLIDKLELSEAVIEAHHIGFRIGPCINAGGRLDTALKAAGLFQEKDIRKAESLAEELVSLNEERKEMTAAETEKAFKLIDEKELYRNSVIVVYLESCHESIAGIVAGRIKERYYRPTFVFTDSEGLVKASGRSIEGYSMYEELVKVKDLMEKFGGHPMAAGLSMKKENLESFNRSLNENADIPEDLLKEKILIDVGMPFSYINEELVKSLELLKPLGNGNRSPVFALKKVRIRNIRIIGKEGNFLKLRLEDGGRVLDALCFRNAEGFKEDFIQRYGSEDWDKVLAGSGEYFADIIYDPQINEFRDIKQVQVLIKDWRFT